MKETEMHAAFPVSSGRVSSRVSRCVSAGLPQGVIAGIRVARHSRRTVESHVALVVGAAILFAVLHFMYLARIREDVRGLERKLERTHRLLEAVLKDHDSSGRRW
jgi:hypothetical protein